MCFSLKALHAEDTWMRRCIGVSNKVDCECIEIESLMCLFKKIIRCILQWSNVKSKAFFKKKTYFGVFYSSNTTAICQQLKCRHVMLCFHVRFCLVSATSTNKDFVLLYIIAARNHHSLASLFNCPLSWRCSHDRPCWHWRFLFQKLLMFFFLLNKRILDIFL